MLGSHCASVLVWSWNPAQADCQPQRTTKPAVTTSNASSWNTNFGRFMSSKKTQVINCLLIRYFSPFPFSKTSQPPLTPGLDIVQRWSQLCTQRLGLGPNSIGLPCHTGFSLKDIKLSNSRWSVACSFINLSTHSHIDPQIHSFRLCWPVFGSQGLECSSCFADVVWKKEANSRLTHFSHT